MARPSKESTESDQVPLLAIPKPNNKRMGRPPDSPDRGSGAKPFVERLLERKSARDWEDEAYQNPTLLIRRTLRSGQHVRFHGNVVILGDVNPGAEITAGGDIIVMGWLRGLAHAGAEGNEHAIVSAFRLSPTQLRIAQYIGRAPDAADAVLPEIPEFAEVREGQLVIDRWQHSVLSSLGR